MSEVTATPVSESRSLINRIIGERYELLETIGEGPTLAAFRARDRALNRIVAVKVLHSSLAALPQAVEAFRDGLAQVISISHDNIARTYDAGDENGLVFLAEEYARSIDLKERIRRLAPFSVNAATDIAVAIGDALKFAHSRGVIHGALCPQDVLVGADGLVKTTGFGLAHLHTIARRVQPDAYMHLLPYFLSPTVAPSAASDIFGLGAIIYEMLIGQPPILSTDMPSLRTINPGVPRALEGIVIKALGSDPAQKYATVGQMLEDLRAVQDAQRYGKSLSWSPLDAPADDELKTLPVPLPNNAARTVARASAPAVTNGSKASEPVVKQPVATEKAAPEPSAFAREENRRTVQYSTNRWLTFVNLLLALLVLAGIGGFAWMTVNFTKPPTEVVVPNLVGKTLLEAQAMASDMKFTLATVEETYRDKEPKDTVYQMRPEPGRRIREGKPISVWISKGPRQVEVPDVRDTSFDKARKSIEKAGLRVGNFTKEFSPVVVNGNVISQTPDPGELKARGSKVDMIISRGDEPPPEPNVDTSPTPGDVVAPTDTTDVAPPPVDKTDGTGRNSDGTEKSRIFEASYPVPDDGAMHAIRIDVSDKDGARTVYSKERRGGETVREDVEAHGSKVTIKLFDNDILVKTQYNNPKKGSGND